MNGFAPRAPLALRTKQVLLRHHLQNRAYVLRHPTMYKYETALELIACFLRDCFLAKDEMVRKQAAATNAELRIAYLCQDTVDEFDSGPYAAGILPAASRAAQPFAQDSACCHEAAVLLFQAPGEGVNLVGGTHAH